jgi:hypothetical protein
MECGVSKGFIISDLPRHASTVDCEPRQWVGSMKVLHQHQIAAGPIKLRIEKVSFIWGD